jgi:hypothetical protein
MQNLIRLVFPLILLSSSGLATLTAADLTDPYQVLNQHYSAIGGLVNLKAAQTQYFEADFALVGTGLEGTVRQWSRSPVQQRQELDLKVIKQTSGDNGEVAWVVDTNGKLKVMRDEETVKQRKINGLMAQYEHLDPSSEIFSVSLFPFHWRQVRKFTGKTATGYGYPTGWTAASGFTSSARRPS